MLVIHVLSFFSSILLHTFQASILFYSTIPIPLMSTIDHCSLQCSHCVFCCYVNSLCVNYCLMFNVHYSHCFLVLTMYEYF